MQRTAGEARTLEAEEVDCTRIRKAVAEAVILRSTHRQTVTRRIQRYRTAELVARIKNTGHVDILSSRVARANDALKRTAGEARALEAEEVNCTRIRNPVAKAVVADSAHRHPVARCVQRYRTTELIARLNHHVHALRRLGLVVVMTHYTLKRAAGEAGIGEGEEIDRSGIGDSILVAVISKSTNRKPVARCVQRHRTAELVVCIEQHVHVLPA